MSRRVSTLRALTLEAHEQLEPPNGGTVTTPWSIRSMPYRAHPRNDQRVGYPDPGSAGWATSISRISASAVIVSVVFFRLAASLKPRDQAQIERLVDHARANYPDTTEIARWGALHRRRLAAADPGSPSHCCNGANQPAARDHTEHLELRGLRKRVTQSATHNALPDLASDTPCLTAKADPAGRVRFSPPSALSDRPARARS